MLSVLLSVLSLRPLCFVFPLWDSGNLQSREGSACHNHSVPRTSNSRPAAQGRQSLMKVTHGKLGSVLFQPVAFESIMG